MLKLTKTGIGLLTKQYRSVLRKCIWINSGICILLTLYSNVASGYNLCFDHSVWDAKMYANVVITPHNCDALGGRYEFALNSDIYTKPEVQNIQSLNYYYTRTEADARYAKLNESNTFTGDQYLKTGYEDHLGLWFWRYGDAGNITLFSGGQRIIQLDGGAQNIQLYRGDGSLGSLIGAGSFKLNGSSTATGIDFAANVTAGTTNASHLATTGAVNQLLNYYYTFRVDEISEPAEFALFLNNEKISNVFEA